jgi:hypothetical protein
MSVSLVNNKRPVVFLSILPTAPILAVVDPLLILKHYGILDLRQVPVKFLGLFNKI